MTARLTAPSPSRLCIGAARVALALTTAALWAGSQQGKNEPNLEKRAMLALDNAGQALTSAREAYEKGDNAQVQAFAKQVLESVQLAETSLQETGKNPRKSPKWFKRAEGATRDLLRRIDAFSNEMSVSDRPMLEPAKDKVQQVHEDLLLGVLEGKPK